MDSKTLELSRRTGRTVTVSADELMAAREWCAELQWGDVDADQIMDQAVCTDHEIALVIDRKYAGGWAQFRRDSVPVLRPALSAESEG